MSAEQCRCGRPLIARDHELEPSCGACRQLADCCDCRQLLPPESQSDRLVVSTGNRNPYDIACDVADYIAKQNAPPQLFAMGDAAVLLRDDGTLFSLDKDNGAGWLTYVAERVDFTASSQGSVRLVAPPAAVMKMMPTLLLARIPPLDGMVTAPYLDGEGRVVAEDGYHKGTRLVLRMHGLDLRPVSVKPTGEEVGEAVQLLTGEWLVDFPFASDGDKATAIAELLTVIGRQFFTLAPMFVNDASTAGSGKGLLTSTVSLIATGEPPHFMELPAAGEEQRKTITAALLDGQSVIAWDEAHTIAGKSLASILTAEYYSARLLGTSRMLTVRNRFTQIALGNNVQVIGDMRRRVVPCRIVPAEERPEHRDNWRHRELTTWVRENRGPLLWAALTIWRNWDVQGRPEATITMGSFEHWGRAIGGALEAAGIKGFGTNTADWLSYSEDEDGWGTHLRQLRERFADRWFTTTAVAEAIEAGMLRRPPTKRDDNKTLAAQLGYLYRGRRENPCEGHWLIRSQARDSADGSYTWAVRQRVHETSADADRSVGAESSSVSPASPVFPGQPPFEGTGDRTGDRSISSNQTGLSPVSPVHLQCQDHDISPAQTDSTGDTGDGKDPSTNEVANAVSGAVP
jgi:hypothetical protein